LACLVAVFAVGAITATSAWAAPEFDSAAYPVEQKATQTNIQGFNGGGVVIACKNFTANTNEEIGKIPGNEAVNPTKNSATLIVHPIYTNCRGTVAAGSFPVTVATEGCNYKVHAAAPNKLEGTVDIVCAAGKEIVNTFVGLTGCTVNVKPQAGLKNVEFKNEPKAGTETQEVTTGSEVAKIKSKAASGCGLVIGTAEFEAEYREGEIESGGLESAKIAPPGHPAKSASKAFSTEGAKPQVAGEVGINEAHWYENHSLLGVGEEAGEQALLWGKLVLTDAGGAGHIGSAECQTELGGRIYNPEGGGPPPGGGMAAAGAGKLVAFQAFNCVSEECKNKGSTLTVTPEGLGVSGLSTLFWESKLSAGPSLKIGNETVGSPTQIKWKVACTGLAYSKSWAGELGAGLESGTAIGSAPSKLTFNSGELKVEGTKEGKVTYKLKMMGYEGGEIISTKNP
jgi:hypothetical protein